jgi:hypothetical protein
MNEPFSTKEGIAMPRRKKRDPGTEQDAPGDTTENETNVQQNSGHAARADLPCQETEAEQPQAEQPNTDADATSNASGNSDHNNQPNTPPPPAANNSDDIYHAMLKTAACAGVFVIVSSFGGPVLGKLAAIAMGAAFGGHHGASCDG